MQSTFFQELSNLAPFVILSDRIYQVTDRPIRLADYIELPQLRLSLLPSSFLQHLEQYERTELENDIFEYKKDYIKKAFDHEIKSRYEIQNYENVTSALKYVLYDLLPLMIDTLNDLGELVGAANLDTRSGKEVMQEITDHELQQADGLSNKDDFSNIKKILIQREERGRAGCVISPGDSILTNKSLIQEYPSLLGELIGHNPLYVSNGQAYLIGEKLDEDDFALYIGNNQYGIKRAKSAIDVEEAYKKEQFRRFRLEAISKFDEQSEAQIKDIKEDKEKRSALEKFAQRSSFNYGNIGYVRKGEEFYVYWEVPKFAMQNPVNPELCNPYPATKVAIPVNASGNGIYSGDACAVDPMMHPFIKDNSEPFGKICDLGRKSFSDDAEGMVQNLSHTVSVFLNGLTIESLESHGAKDESARFWEVPLRKKLEAVGYLTIEEARQNGYRITNQWVVDGKRI